MRNLDTNLLQSAQGAGGTSETGPAMNNHTEAGIPSDTGALTDPISIRFHAGHRRELAELTALARRVEKAHPADIDTPQGLTQAVEALTTELEAHMRAEEDAIFAARRLGTVREAVVSTPHYRKDHDGQEAAMNRIAANTHVFCLSHNACAISRNLYPRLGKLAEVFDEHKYLADGVLFRRLAAQA